MTFVNLHTHSNFSQLDGYAYPEDFVARAVELGHPALALTDHGNMFGAFKHWKACKAAGIKPILGMEAYLAPGELTRERVIWGELEEDGRTKPAPTNGAYTHLTVLAENSVGLRRLYELHARSYTEGYYHKPRISRDLLAEKPDGLIILSGCVGGEVATRIRLEQWDEALECATWFRNVFGDRYFIEIMNHDLPFEESLNASLCDLAEILDIPMVATQDCHYPYPEDARGHEALLCLSTVTNLQDPKRLKFSNDEFYLKPVEEMFTVPEEAIQNTLKIADLIQDNAYDSVFENQGLMPQGDSFELRQRSIEGLREYTHGMTLPEYSERLDFELQIIEEKGYAGYFLCLADICQWADSQGVFRGFGRGSGGGSLVARVLGITKIDPIEHDLLFERFLNPERVSMPDIDLDFESARQHEVMQYAIDRFGAENCARIITFGTIKTRGAIRDAAKVLGRTPKEAATLSSLVPPDRRGRQANLDEVPKIRQAAPDVYELAEALDGQIRNQSIHAGGLVISPVPLDTILPLKRDPKGGPLITGYDMGEIEDLGLVKNDILAVTEFDVLKTTIGFISDGTS